MNNHKVFRFFIFVSLVVLSKSHPFLDDSGTNLEINDLQIERPETVSSDCVGNHSPDVIEFKSELTGYVGNDGKEDTSDNDGDNWRLNAITGDEEEKNAEKKQHFDIPLGIPEEDTNIPGEPLTPEDFRNAKELEVLVPPQSENSRDPIESAGLFEGDISGVNTTHLYNERNAVRKTRLKWPRGIIPYVISAAYNVYERSVIAAAFIDYHEHTCIRFVPRTTQKDYVHLVKGAGCSSNVGRSGRGQMVSLGAGCVYKGIVIHELMHATGFWHEQSRSDRDSHITILWRNIIPGMEFNFQKISRIDQQTLGTPYDAGSVMHYSKYAFARNYRSPTIVSKTPGVDFVGERRGFSKIDLLKLNKLYECGKGSVLPPVYPKPPPFNPDACSDNSRHCSYWSRVGDCNTNPTWMLANCAKSCKQCGAGCSDYNQRCARWAQLGECTQNPEYMTIYCSESCLSCNRGDQFETEGCVNRNVYCDAWSKRGQCQVNPSYMLHYCSKSCGQC